MATLLYHIQLWLWIHKSIVEVVDRIEKRVAQQTEQKIQAVCQLLETF